MNMKVAVTPAQPDKGSRVHAALGTYSQATNDLIEAKHRQQKARIALAQSVLDAGMIDCLSVNVPRLRRILR